MAVAEAAWCEIAAGLQVQGFFLSRGINVRNVGLCMPTCELPVAPVAGCSPLWLSVSLEARS